MPEVTGSSPVSSTIQNAGSYAPRVSFFLEMRAVRLRGLSLTLVAWLALCGAADAASPPSARDVLTELKALHTELSGGLDYAEYRRRLVATRATFDRYAERASTTVHEAEAKAALSAVMNYHRFAESLWADRLRREGSLPLASFERLVVLLDHFPCPALRPLVDTVMKRGGQGGVVDGVWGERAVRLLWACASDKIAEAERIIGPAAR